MLKISIVLLLIGASRLGLAHCLDILKLELQSSIGITYPQLNDLAASKFHLTENAILYVKLSELKNRKHALRTKVKDASKKLIKSIDEGVFPESIHKYIKVLYESIHDPALISSWAQKLYYDLIIQVYAEGSHSSKELFANELIFAGQDLIDVLVERSKRGGFSGSNQSVELVTRELNEYEFSKLLRDQKLIVDLALMRSDHGHLIHFLQVDLFIFAIEQKNLDPMKFSEIYQWFGQRINYQLSSGEKFNSFSDGWEAMFDSLELDITSTEFLNLIIQKYLHWET